MPSRWMKPCWSGSRAFIAMPHSLSTPIASSLQRGCKCLAEGVDNAGRPGPAQTRRCSMAIDETALNEMLHQFVIDLGATVAAGGVVLGDRLGLYQALAQSPARAAELADRTGTATRYVAEWLRGQAAGGYVTYNASTDTYSMTEEQAFVLANPDGVVFAPGAFQLALGSLHALPEIEQAFKTGAGVGWHEHDNDVFEGCERFFRPGYIGHLVPSWIP